MQYSVDHPLYEACMVSGGVTEYLNGLQRAFNLYHEGTGQTR